MSEQRAGRDDAQRCLMEANAVAGSLGTVVAERTLTFVERGQPPVRVVIGKPRKDRASGDYACPYRIEGIGTGLVQHAWGIDSVQALQSAMQAIRAELAPLADRMEWSGGQGGSLGFPMMIPDVFGSKLSSRLERMVERETDRYARALERTGRRPAAKKVGTGARKRPSRT